MSRARMTTPQRRDGTRASRRVGYVISVVVNAVLLFLITVAPGWQWVPFLTEEFERVLVLTNVSLWVGIVAGAINFIVDRAALRAFLELVTTVIALVLSVRMWQVFPFGFAGAGFPWETFVRGLLILAIVGTSIAIVVQLVVLVRVRR